MVSSTGSRRGRCATVLIWVLAILSAAGAAGPAGAVPPPGPGRIAIVGQFATGYAGVLSRYGIPREVLVPSRMMTPTLGPDTFAAYDVIILAGIGSIGGQSLTTTFSAMLEKGGAILVDGAGLYNLRGRPAFGEGGVRVRGGNSLRLVGENNPLRKHAGIRDTYACARAMPPTPLQPGKETVLAEFGQGADGTATPAIILEQVGKGKVIQCGVPLSSTLGAADDYDQLILALLETLTDGRVQAQIESETPHLGVRQTVRSAGRAPAATDEKPAPKILAAPQWPAGKGARGKLPSGFTEVEADPAPEFNLAAKLVGGSAEVLLNTWSGSQGVRISAGPAGMKIVRVAGGKPAVLASSARPVVPGTLLLVKERRARLMVLAGTAALTASTAGLCRGAVAYRGKLDDVRYQPVEPAYFSDDFMRTTAEKGGWETQGGNWQTASVLNPDMGANPFSYRASATDVGLAFQGHTFWDDYRFSASVRPETSSGDIGLCLYARDAANMLIFRARVGTALEDGFSLVRLVDGKATVLAKASGGLARGQWYRLQAKVDGPEVTAFVDGAKLLSARDTSFPGGRIALRVENTSARFDDVLVEPASAPAETGQRLVARVLPYAGVADLDSWAGPATMWDASPEMRGLFWRRGAFYGDTGLRFDVASLPAGGEAGLLLDGDGRSADSGYWLSVRKAGAGLRVELRHAGQVAAHADVPARQSLALALRREGDRVLGLIDGRVVVSMHAAKGAGGARVGFRALGFRPRISQVALWSGSVRDYLFDAAPTDWWVGSGEWDVTNRWSCTPDWSWFGGYSDGTAAIWHKAPLVGDVVLDYFAAPKMIGRPGVGGTSERISDFNAVLCGDGRDVASGYAFVIAGDGTYGAKILRRGQVVAEVPYLLGSLSGGIHNRWLNIRAEKHGTRLQLFLDGAPVLSYTDPQPLPDGYAAIWTKANGIMLPRITIYSEGIGSRLLSLAGPAAASPAVPDKPHPPVPIIDAMRAQPAQSA